MANRIPESELIVNPNGSIYHLKLKPEDIADDIILVGDPGRVATVSACFDSIEFKQQNREIHTHTGHIGKKRITVMSTGMGTDNQDIVINELDALANIDLQTRQIKDQHRGLRLYRLGTSGALQADIAVDTFMASSHGIGLDGMLWFYEQATQVVDASLTQALKTHVQWPAILPQPYVVAAAEGLINTIGKDFAKGMTATAPGFFGPQGRILRMPLAFPELNEQLRQFQQGALRITNFEMETSALYGLSAILGHQAMTVCAIIANRYQKAYSADYKKTVQQLIETLLDKIASTDL